MRKIIHCDFDCFYAAVETRDNPSLQGKAIAIGGDEYKRGVIATCSYEARRSGVKSAMATATARRLCPELIVIKPNMEKYREASKQAHQIFQKYSDIIEPLSLDEAFLDVSESRQYKGSATLIAEALRKEIFSSLSITASAGIAPNKFLAKIASDWNKPNGQFVVRPEDVDSFVYQLPIGKIFGVGKVTESKMKKLGLYTCGDLRTLGEKDLNQHFGKFGDRLYQLCRGQDDRPVNTSRVRKSLSVEHTYPEDLTAIEDCLEEIPSLYQELKLRLEKSSRKNEVSGIFIKLKFADFTTTTAEQTSLKFSIKHLEPLMLKAFERNPKNVRLIGMGVRFRTEHQSNQLDFWPRLDTTIDNKT